MSNLGNERRRGDPVGSQVPELLNRGVGDLALGLNGQEPQTSDLMAELGINPADVRRYHREQLALEGVELAR